MDGKLAGGVGSIICTDDGDSQEGFNIFVLVWNECLVLGLPGVVCLPQWDRSQVGMLEEERNLHWQDVYHDTGMVSWICCIGCDCAGGCIGCEQCWFCCNLEFCGFVECCVWDVNELQCAAPLQGISNESEDGAMEQVVHANGCMEALDAVDDHGGAVWVVNDE